MIVERKEENRRIDGKNMRSERRRSGGDCGGDGGVLAANTGESRDRGR